MRPTAVASWWVSCVSTIQSCATRCIQVPMFDTRPPAVHKRKLKFSRARKALESGFLMGAPGCCLREAHRNAGVLWRSEKGFLRGIATAILLQVDWLWPESICVPSQNCSGTGVTKRRGGRARLNAPDSKSHFEVSCTQSLAPALSCTEPSKLFEFNDLCAVSLLHRSAL